MNAVEIEQAITELAEQPFDATEFPFAFLEAFGNKATTIKKLRNAMPDNLRAAHEANDTVIERIYMGRRFKNDTARLEKLFEMYTKITTQVPA